MSNELQQMFEIFGLGRYANKLYSEGNTAQLKKLEDLISQFILVKAFNDLPEGAKDKLKKADIKSAADLYTFFNSNIKNFDDRVKDYGREFAFK